MPDRPSETALLQAVELLMGQFSEQILTLLEAHARGDVESEDFEARIRDLVGAVSPEAVARHPGRLALVRPAPSAPMPQPEPPSPAADTAPMAEPEPLPEPVFELEIFPAAEPAVESAPPESLPEPPALAEPAAAPEPADAEPAIPAQPEAPAILDGVSGFEPLPDFEWEAAPAEPSLEFASAPDAGVLAEPESPAVLLPELGAEPEVAPLAAPSFLDGPVPEPAPAVAIAPEPQSEAASALDLEISPLPGPAEPEPLPELVVELEIFPAVEPVVESVPAEPLPEPPALSEPAAGLEPADVEPAIPAQPEAPAILDGVSGFEPLPDFEWEAAPAAPALEFASAPDAGVSAGPEPPAPPLPEPAPPVEALPRPESPAPAAESPLVLDGVSGYDHLLEPEAEEPPPPPSPSPARVRAEAPRPAPTQPGPAVPARPRKAPAQGVVVVPSTPSHTPGGRPTAPGEPIPQPKAPAAAKPGPAPAAKAPAGPAKAPPPCRPKPTGMGGNVVVSGRLGNDAAKAPERPSMGFGAQMFGNGDKEEAGGDRATSFVSRQVRRDLQDKSTWKSPAKAALLSGLLPGVGDFYLGKVGNGLVFYLVFYILLMLLILRGDLILLAVLAILAMVSSGMSWLGAQKHNDAIHRIQDAPSLQKKTRETTFTFDTSRRRR